MANTAKDKGTGINRNRLAGDNGQGDEHDLNNKEVDHRLKDFETPELRAARNMEHGYDGRGRVTDEGSDRRLTDQETPELYDARHMTRGYDGRGRVRKRGSGKVDTSKQFEGNENATGGRANTPQYLMSPEERARVQEERLRNQGSGGTMTRKNQPVGKDRIKKLIIMFLDENEGNGGSVQEIQDFCREHGINESITNVLASMRGEHDIIKSDDNRYYLPDDEDDE